jgi:hypothetical protein
MIVLFIQLFLILVLSIYSIVFTTDNSCNMYIALISIIINACYVHSEISILNVYRTHEKLLNFTWFQIIAFPLVYLSLGVAIFTNLLYIPAIAIGLWEVCLLISILKTGQNAWVLFYGIAIFLYISSVLTYYVFISAKISTFLAEIACFSSIFIFFVICALDLHKIKIEIRGDASYSID